MNKQKKETMKEILKEITKTQNEYHKRMSWLWEELQKEMKR